MRKTLPALASIAALAPFVIAEDKAPAAPDPLAEPSAEAKLTEVSPEKKKLFLRAFGWMVAKRSGLAQLNFTEDEINEVLAGATLGATGKGADFPEKMQLLESEYMAFLQLRSKSDATPVEPAQPIKMQAKSAADQANPKNAVVAKGKVEAATIASESHVAMMTISMPRFPMFVGISPEQKVIKSTQNLEYSINAGTYNKKKGNELLTEVYWNVKNISNIPVIATMGPRTYIFPDKSTFTSTSSDPICKVIHPGATWTETDREINRWPNEIKFDSETFFEKQANEVHEASKFSHLFSVPNAPRERGEWSETSFTSIDRLQIGLSTQWLGNDDEKSYAVRWRIKNTGATIIDVSIPCRKYQCAGDEHGGNVVAIPLYLKSGESREFEDTVFYTHREPLSVDIKIEKKTK